MSSNKRYYKEFSFNNTPVKPSNGYVYPPQPSLPKETICKCNCKKCCAKSHTSNKKNLHCKTVNNYCCRKPGYGLATLLLLAFFI